jgi:hypothetical protein
VTIWVENPGPPVVPRPTEPGEGDVKKRLRHLVLAKKAINIIGLDLRRLARSPGRLDQLAQHRRLIVAVPLRELGGVFFEIAVDELQHVRRLARLVSRRLSISLTVNSPSKLGYYRASFNPKPASQRGLFAFGRSDTQPCARVPCDGWLCNSLRPLEPANFASSIQFRMTLAHDIRRILAKIILNAKFMNGSWLAKAPWFWVPRAP